MVTSGVAVDARCSAEFAHPHDGRVFQQTALLQVGRQTADSLIQDRQFVVGQGVENVGMVVPTAKIHFNKWHSVFHQTTSQHAAFAEVVVAVKFGHGCWFFSHFEGLHLF